MNVLSFLHKREDVFIAVLVVSIIGVMILPLPPFILDILLSLSISLSITILVTSVYVRKPLDFSVLPSVLLMATLYRLALNVASTRLILLRGNEGIDAAGQVIKSFGNFVVGGNYAVGIVVFMILVIINFVVITKGSGRIAEVAARFTLDAMPGKQMAIDADLNTGLIDDKEARKRREQIAQEADFYGAMDGASKFVRGDAVAGLIITAINILGGLIIGVLQKGMPITDAATTYTILTIGDGLVAQIPALLTSTAAGIVVSRAGKEGDIGKDITQQMLINPKALVTMAGILMVLGLVPGLPHIPFFIISIGAGGMAYAMTRVPVEEAARASAQPPVEEQKIESYLEIDPVGLEIGYGLIPLVEEPGGDLLRKIKAMRRQIATEIGFVVSPIHIKDNLQLRPHEYSFMVRGIEIARGEVMMGSWLAVASGDAERIDGVPTKEPAFGLPAFWIDEKDVEKAQLSGYMVVDTSTVIGTHITELIRGHAHELLTRGETQKMLDNVAKSYPKIIEELIPAHLTLGAVQRVLQNLLKERVPVKDLITILDTLLDYAPGGVKDPEALTEYVRQALARTITKQYVNEEGRLPVFTLDPTFEKLMSQVESGSISPDVINKLAKSIEKVLTSGKLKGSQPVILCSANVRRYLRRIVERLSPSIVVLSSSEIVSTTNLDIRGMVRYEN
ncbi:MAG: flagellar biosynthesis protein FlhA [Nitrospirae bacterium]|nr:flagellar biosynthesis protein FlhA [Nitrospirota bacterium]